MKIQGEHDFIDKEKLELDGFSVYIEKYEKEPQTKTHGDLKKYNFNAIQEICLTSISQGKDLLCRSVIMKEKMSQKRQMNLQDDRVTTWVAGVAGKVFEKKKVLVIMMNRDLGEAVKKELLDLTRAKVATVFSKQEEVEEVDVLVTTPVYGFQLISKKKIQTRFDLLVVDECQKFNEGSFFRIVFDIRRLLGPEAQVVIFSPIFSRENFSDIMREDRVVVEVENMEEIDQQVVHGRTQEESLREAIRIIKEGKFHFKSSWREVVEIDKILIVVKEYKQIESHLSKEKIPFKTLETRPKEKQMNKDREDQIYREGILDKFKAGAFPVLVSDRYTARGISISGLSLVLSLDYSDTIRDYLFRSTLLKKGAKLVTFVSGENSPGFLEDLISTFEINKVGVPDFLRTLKNEAGLKPKARKPRREDPRREDPRREDLTSQFERLDITEDKDVSEDEELNVWG